MVTWLKGRAQGFSPLSLASLVFITANVISVDAAEFIEGNERTKSRPYSPAVITDGGRIVWVAGMGGTTDPDGKPIRISRGGQQRPCCDAVG